MATALTRPGTAELVAAGGCAARARGVSRVAEGAIEQLGTPSAALARAREAAEGVGESRLAGLNPAPETPLHVRSGPASALLRHRRQTGRLQDSPDRLLRNVNDVVFRCRPAR